MAVEVEPPVQCKKNKIQNFLKHEYYLRDNFLNREVLLRVLQDDLLLHLILVLLLQVVLMVLLYQHSRGAAVATEGGDVHRRRRRRRHIRVRRSVHCDVVGDHGVRGRDDGSRRRGDLVAAGRRAGGLLPSAAAAAADGEEVVEGDVLDDDVLGGAALVSPVLPLVGVLAAGGPLRELRLLACRHHSPPLELAQKGEVEVKLPRVAEHACNCHNSWYRGR